MAGLIFNIDAAIQNSVFNVLQEPIKMIMENQVEAFEKNSIIPQFFVMKTTDKYREEFRSRTAMDGFKPTEDMEPAGISSFQDSYNKQFVFQTWTNAYVISKQAMEDGQLNNVESDTIGFVKTYNRTRELYAVKLIGCALKDPSAEDAKNFALSSKSGLGMDTTDGEIEGTKQRYFHNAHKGVKIDGASKTTQSNKFVANLKWDGTETLLEEKVLNILGQVESTMSAYTDDKGNIIGTEPTRIIMGQDYQLKDVLERALASRYGSAMGSNGVNTRYGNFEIVSNKYLSGVDGFTNADHGLILLDPVYNKEGLGAVWFDRTPLEVSSYIDKRTKANIVDGRGRYGAGFGDFRAMSYVNLANLQTDNATVLTPLATGVQAVTVVGAVPTKATGAKV